MLSTAKIKMGSNSVNTDDRVTILTSCNVPHSHLSVYKVSCNYLQYFERHAPDKSVTDGQMDGRTKRRLYDLPLGSIKTLLLIE